MARRLLFQPAMGPRERHPDRIPERPHPIAARAADLLVRRADRSLELPPAAALELKDALATIQEAPLELLHAVASFGVLILCVREQGSEAAADDLAQLISASTTGAMLMQAALISGDTHAEHSGVIAKLLGKRLWSDRPDAGEAGQPSWTFAPVAMLPRRV